MPQKTIWTIHYFRFPFRGAVAPFGQGVTGREEDGQIVFLPHDSIFPPAAEEEIAAGASVQPVVTIAAEEHVVAAAAVQPVVAVVALEPGGCVDAAGDVQVIVTRQAKGHDPAHLLENGRGEAGFERFEPRAKAATGLLRRRFATE